MGIETPRLRLRALREDDAEALARIFAHPSVVRYSGGRSPNLDEVRTGILKHISGYDGRGYGLFAVERKDTGEVVGRVGFLTPDVDPTADAELHYHMAPSSWGSGLATEATRAVLEWGFGKGHFGRVVAAIHPDNHASRRVAEKCGLTFWKETELQGCERFQLYHVLSPSAI